jgi:hypothetical protein
MHWPPASRAVRQLIDYLLTLCHDTVVFRRASNRRAYPFITRFSLA